VVWQGARGVGRWAHGRAGSAGAQAAPVVRVPGGVRRGQDLPEGRPCPLDPYRLPADFSAHPPSGATSSGAAAAHASGNCLPERGTVLVYETPSLDGPGPARGEDLEMNLEKRCSSKATPDVGRHGPVATSTQA
jgi:hypothetical protein